MLNNAGSGRADAHDGVRRTAGQIGVVTGFAFIELFCAQRQGLDVFANMPAAASYGLGIQRRGIASDALAGAAGAVIAAGFAVILFTVGGVEICGILALIAARAAAARPSSFAAARILTHLKN
ncbi:hypothetical protein AGMMS49992_30730 [Clostridia bacterium]|nr:hypothetical protein AGMMS49992_30730 [Clostridia bacterium]